MKHFGAVSIVRNHCRLNWLGWKTSGAARKPIVAHGKCERGNITVMDINPTFRAHTELTFRLLANSIYSDLD